MGGTAKQGGPLWNAIRNPEELVEAQNASPLQRQLAREHRESLELDLLAQIKLAGLPEPEREARWHPARRWRFDMLWRDRMIAAEVEGGTWLAGGGRHNRGRGYEEDCAKYNEAMLMGYRVLRFTRDAIEDGSAVATLERALRGERE